MNRTKDTIGWCDFSWNPITGCDHGCWFCYAAKICKRFPRIFPNGFHPTFYPERLQEPWLHKKPSKIFTCSISDLFAKWTHPDWRAAVLQSIFDCPVPHIFQLLTKNPENIPVKVKFPANVWIGTTITMEDQLESLGNLLYIKMNQARVKFASFEPLLGKLSESESLSGLDWIIIGKLTGSRRVQLKPEWVWRIVNEAKQKGIPLFMKNNLAPVIPKEELIQEFPEYSRSWI